MSEYQKLSIKDWAVEDRPREKSLKHGMATLSNAELVAILIGSGNAEESAVELSKRILSEFRNNLNEFGKASVERLMQLKGIGEAKAINILAALELGKRRKVDSFELAPKINSSSDAYNQLTANLSYLQHEEFWIVYLDRANKILDKTRISQGGITGTVVDVKIILKNAIEKLASSIILAHNHPSGNLTASTEDKLITSKIAKAASLMNIKVLDHIIIGNDSYLSFADEGLLLE